MPPTGLRRVLGALAGGVLGALMAGLLVLMAGPSPWPWLIVPLGAIVGAASPDRGVLALMRSVGRLP